MTMSDEKHAWWFPGRMIVWEYTAQTERDGVVDGSTGRSLTFDGQGYHQHVVLPSILIQ